MFYVLIKGVPVLHKPAATEMLTPEAWNWNLFETAQFFMQ